MDQDLQALQQVRDLVERAKKAQAILECYSQDEVDRLVGRMAEYGFKASKELAELACEETKYGSVASKVEKNMFATRNVYESIKNLRTVGIVRVDQERQVYEIATPMGIVAAIIPVTNPTSTALFKILIAIKARCTIILSPHPKAVKCIQECARIMMKAAESVGAPEGLVGSLTIPTMNATQELMRHRDIGIILATGGSGLVKAAYSSGKPAIGVGPGNVPVYVEKSADVNHAIRCLVSSKGFDWGTLCCSEQAVLLDKSIEADCMREFQKQKAHLCNERETKALEALMPPGGALNPELVGQSPQAIAKMASFTVPADCTLILARQQGVGDAYPLSREKLAPILAIYTVDGWQVAMERALEILKYGGMGHTFVMHSKNQEIVNTFAMKMPASRILINTPASQGAVGYSTGIMPSMTLGCGTMGGNITSDNISSIHLINIKRVAIGNTSWFADLPAPKLNLGLAVEESKPKYRSNLFDEMPGGKKRYFVGPYNDPNI